jgi:transketolase
MRGAFTQTLVELAAKDERIMLLTGDLGFMALEPFSERFPKRFINAGVAEQNMVGIATGLAEAGFIPFVYSITPFASLRPYEFIRNGPVMHHLPVRIVGIGGGFEYGHAGKSHYGLEDVAVMRAQPGMNVMAPADAMQTRTIMRETVNLPGPIYYRLGKDDKTMVPGLEGAFKVGHVQLIGEGDDLLIVSMGAISSEAAAAMHELEASGTRCTLAVVASISPAPVDDLVKLLKRFRVVMTVEAHYRIGGVGSLVCEVAAEHGLGCRVVRCGVGRVDGRSGSQPYMERQHGLSREALVATAAAITCGANA